MNGFYGCLAFGQCQTRQLVNIVSFFSPLISTSFKWMGSPLRHKHEQNGMFTDWTMLEGLKEWSEKQSSAVTLGYPERLQLARREK